ncbi:hypothetical protein M409DRAFT_51684 [Zasmidium cellare ATCC 36951]|uniref:tRNA (guanine(9)-N1)-methyltransferase n=1 Tax=Zasmidium cellare ATCC 36951 TaxID=1080233 RepID=A0A6A6CVE5_ZASCE|nr:uncharacterized protein M409DRAFT_51684 [Zasmidium cellare ATCC 36951]KAF2170683.1 hypothetical protein M409DRAFT_51684 [Zasmidium cellare ATCC 36951]
MESEERPTKLRKLSHDNIKTENGPKDDFEASHVRSENGHADATNELGKELPKAEDTHHDEKFVEEDDHLPNPEETAPSLAAINSGTGDPPLSKNQMKKLRRKAEWESKRDERKVVRKEKAVARRERKKAAKQEAEAKGEAPAEPQRQLQTHAVQLPVTIVIDCDFDDLMRDNERISLAAQITRCYSDNRKSLFRAHIVYCSFGGKLKERFDTVLDKNYQSFRGVRALDSDFVETAEKAKEWMSAAEGGKLAGVFSKYAELDDEKREKLKAEGEVVYLSSEADEDLTELKPYSTYIIGGLVDKNREKGVCHRRATNRGIRTARLPIGQYMEMQSRKVLATNHVNEIMIKWLECGDWGEAFMKVIPKRKGGSLKGEEGIKEEDDKKEDHEEGDDNGEEHANS